MPEIVKPESQVGWHLDPLARVLVQLPTAPLVGATDASHEFASHVAAVVIPAVQEVVPEIVKPESQVGWHLDPLARVLVQLPTAPLVGATDASHEFASHVAAVVVPAVQDVVPETV